MCAALALKTNDLDRRRRHLLSSSKYNANLGPNRRYWGRNCRLCQRPILRFLATDFVHTLLICDKPVYENVGVKIVVVFLVCNRKTKKEIAMTLTNRNLDRARLRKHQDQGGFVMTGS